MNIMNDEFAMQARELHRCTMVIDTHFDTTHRLMDPNWDFAARDHRGHVDIPRLRDGGIDAMFLAVWAPDATAPGAGVAAGRAQIRIIQETIRRHETHLTQAYSADDVRRAREQGRIAVFIAIEGGNLIEDSLEVLREYHGQGATYLTLTHAFHTNWADSSGGREALSPRHGGLTSFGRDVIREMNRLGMLVDVSHVSDATFQDVVEISTAPIIATHSSCRARCSHHRNLTDEMMRAIAATGGVVQINFVPAFLDPSHPPIPASVFEPYAASGLFGPFDSEHTTALALLADHFDHALKAVGPEHVGIGSDFDGIPNTPAGLEDCSKLPNLTAELLRRGHSQADLTKVLGENVLRVMDACRKVAESAQDRGQSEDRATSEPRQD